jgi:acetyl-CoA carboxylase biotin carboxylase subunit
LAKVLVANRGEIAVRIARTCRAMGVATVAVYSEADRAALHVQCADQAACIGPPEPRASYLNMDAILDAARVTGADAIHPGYGFLSENAVFAQRVREAGLIFVGPPVDAIAVMGDKLVSRARAAAAGVPVVPGTEVAVPQSGEQAHAVAEQAAALGYPVLVKAAAGGGGKGMRVVGTPGELAAAFAAGAREAATAFGDGRLYLEKYLDRPRHIEVQILADTHGTIVHLGERECSIQRRHQKIIEETPAPRLSPDLRRQITDAAATVARAVDYTNAGTVEFLLARDGKFYFLEMNTRLQVEHAITEWVTGLDLVREQLRVAAGERLGYAQADIQSRGAALECRIYAEDPASGFLPSAGLVRALHEPGGPGVRVDSGLLAGVPVTVEYDPLLAKLTTWALTRTAAIERMAEAVADYAIVGPTTNIAFLADILRHPAFRTGETHTGFVGEHFPRWVPDTKATRDAAAIVAALVLAGTEESEGRGAGTIGVMARGGQRTEALPSPWTTLGAWRVGSTGRWGNKR